jgi:hypothetical protein
MCDTLFRRICAVHTGIIRMSASVERFHKGPSQSRFSTCTVVDMRTWMVLLAMSFACAYPPLPALTGDGGGIPDAPPTCFGSFVRVCFTTPADVPTMPAMLPSDLTIEIDTGSSPLCDQNNDQKGDFCVVAGAGFTLATDQSIRGYGTKPLMLLSTTTITLEATSTVDVSSTRGSEPVATGAGANSSMCTSGMAPENEGGGYGGSFGGKGGNGEQAGGTTGGTSAAAFSSPPMTLRGGCRGSDGAAAGGVGGSGGGAVALIAAMSIQFDGTVNASGAGGKGGLGGQRSGGGGGGSGGIIILDAASIVASGPLFANGGGGGQGGAIGGANAGADGGESLAPLTAALAGNNGTTDGGSGGAGSFGIRLDGGNGGSVPAINGGGGGGGGGGAGFIRAPGVTTNISPPSFVP